MLAGPAGVRPQAPAAEGHGIGGFQNFQRRDGCHGYGRVAVAQAVTIGMTAMPAAKEREHYPPAAIITMSGKGQGVDRAISIGQCPRRVQPANGGKDNINDPQNGLGISANGLWGICRKQRLIGNDDLYRVKYAGICRHIRKQVL